MNSRIASATGLVAALLVAFLLPVLAQSGQISDPSYFQSDGATFDLTGGLWQPRMHEEQFERAPGRELGDYLGLPINDAARKRAESYKGSFMTLPEWQCRPMMGDAIWRGPALVKFWNEYDPVTRQVIAIHEEGSRSYDRPIWMDRRPRPPANAPHDWNGFSTGEWDGDVLVTTNTHIKEGYLERNGVPRSDLAMYRQYFLRYDNWMTVVTITYDPVYLTEPFILSSEYQLDPQQQQLPYPCTVVEEIDRPRGVFPHWLPGTNKAVEEFATRHKLPVEAALGGAETAYPEYRTRLKALAADGAGTSK
jgi:hypothetical protein